MEGLAVGKLKVVGVTVTVLAALAVGGIYSLRRTPLRDFTGHVFDVRLSKGLWIHCLDSPTVDRVELVQVSEHRVCFAPPDRPRPALPVSRSPSCSKDLQMNADNMFCVAPRDLSALYLGPIRVWGTGSARGSDAV